MSVTVLSGLGIFLQPGHQLADQIAPAYPQAAGADLLQQLHGPLGEQLIGGVVVPAVLHQHAALDGAGQPQPVQQAGRSRPLVRGSVISTTPSSRASASIRLTRGRDTPSSRAMSLCFQSSR